jgi:3-oxoacyl-[acyl-carrier-protein] synthase-1
MAIRQALDESDTDLSEVDFISAHGTATIYNDEMEAKAFYGIGLGDVPLNSLKGSFGHTLGGAGVLETVMSLHSLRQNEVLPTVGFDSHGVSQPVNVNKSLLKKSLRVGVKTASGFGGCNAAIVLKKVK